MTTLRIATRGSELALTHEAGLSQVSHPNREGEQEQEQENGVQQAGTQLQGVAPAGEGRVSVKVHRHRPANLSHELNERRDWVAAASGIRAFALQQLLVDIG